ncbi:translation elongation factor 2 (EF-2/EF-G) [Nitrospirillum amazonense]|uniref:Elongation factor G n=1 Tax=Nitrospirillum amazonense TaxID=28077 RepID=A0A560J4P3_9PROT|nr:elongation factor G [Nitrospirillum amazonense]TWB66213.1 translation elongation factor 2 (EF-2/EF-G) [Nitrospirillum amazonense]
MSNGTRTAPRCAALVGPYLSGKTTLLESLLMATGQIARKGSVQDGTSAGDASAEARARHMSTEVSVHTCAYLGDPWHILDCPGSIELAGDAARALMVADVAVVVCEPVPDKAAMLAPLLRFLDENAIPHLLFVNKVDQMGGGDVRVADLMTALEGVSQRPLVLRQVPIRQGRAVTGYVDLVSERAYRYCAGAKSETVPMPDAVLSRERAARQDLLEALADFDDALLEQLLDDVSPPPADVYRQLSRDLADDLIVPVFLGSAQNDHGVRRLLKALRHEAPPVGMTARRLGLEGNGVLVQPFRIHHAPHSGRLAYCRVWQGEVTDGQTLGPDRVGGIFALGSATPARITGAGPGAVVALAKLEHAQPGALLSARGEAGTPPSWPATTEPVHALAVRAEQRADEVKLTGALAKLLDEDPDLRLEMEGGEMVLSGQGTVHLGIALDRLRGRFGLGVTGRPPAVPYRESIRRMVAEHARFKRQSGGHGQFADVQLTVTPLDRGEGFRFEDKVVGGAIPRSFIPAVEDGAREALACGPLGFPVVDVSVTLTGGQFHAVDSSEQAFRTAGRMAVQEALTKAEPVLLEPVLLVTVVTPTEFTAKAQRLLSGRRGQILGFDVRPGWSGWDQVTTYVPQADMGDFIVDLRSLTLGLGGYTARFDHLTELMGRLADRVVEGHQAGYAAQ